MVAIAVVPALIFPQHPQVPETGKHPVTTALFSYANQNQTETFTNTGEKRKVNVEFWYPADATTGEKYPLVGRQKIGLGEYMGIVGGKPVLNNTPFPVPILSLLTDDLTRGIETIPNANDVMAVKHVAATGSHPYEIDPPGTNRLSVTDMAPSSPLLTSLLNGSVHHGSVADADPLATMEKLNATILDFYNAFLKVEGSFSAWGTE